MRSLLYSLGVTWEQEASLLKMTGPLLFAASQQIFLPYPCLSQTKNPGDAAAQAPILVATRRF